jgi:hypothetical protein
MILQPLPQPTIQDMLQHTLDECLRLNGADTKVLALTISVSTYKKLLEELEMPQELALTEAEKEDPELQKLPQEAMPAPFGTKITLQQPTFTFKGIQVKVVTGFGKAFGWEIQPKPKPNKR